MSQQQGSFQRSRPFNLKSPYEPAGDQPKVIESLTQSVLQRNREQTMQGVTGSGKTYMMAKIIQNLQRPTLVIAHNKTLAAQLAEEFRHFFPDNAVNYFVSYYDYYQPESYIPRSDTYIEKQTQINEEIDRFRNASMQALLTRKDTIIVSSVSCIYGVGSPEDFNALKLELAVGSRYNLPKLSRRLVDLQYSRTNMDLARGQFRIIGDQLEIYPSGEEVGYRFGFFGDELEHIVAFHPVTNDTVETMQTYSVFPARQYVTTQEKVDRAIDRIKEDLAKQVRFFESEGKILQAERIKQRTNNDLEMLQALGFVGGIENYSVYFEGRKDGEPPTTLLDYFSQDFLCFIDESHITLPQIGAMYNGDRSRKTNLVDYGFRLPSAMNNRPLQIDEFFKATNQITYISATPSDFELGKKDSVGRHPIAFREEQGPKDMTIAKAIIRPTGLLDPIISVRPIKNQVDDVMAEIHLRIAKGQRVLITTLTKKFAEELDVYLKELNINSAYIHSDIDTMERVEILSDLRRGKYDVLVGINLLREGLDLPEVSLVAIFDADKEGFLRSSTSLTQIVGRAARHSEGVVVMYANTITESMRKTIEETEERRDIQMKYNKLHGITPITTKRELKTILEDLKEELEENADYGSADAIYSPQGWKEKQPMMVMDSSKGAETSIHGSKTQVRKPKKQLYANFTEEKEKKKQSITASKQLSREQLRNKLNDAIESQDFELAAAIRDVLNTVS
jgi:excinuclease ABC subunit B